MRDEPHRDKTIFNCYEIIAFVELDNQANMDWLAIKLSQATLE